MGINLKQVHENTTSDEWSERYDEMFGESQLLISELGAENRKLKKGLAFISGIAFITTGILLKKRGNH